MLLPIKTENAQNTRVTVDSKKTSRIPQDTKVTIYNKRKLYYMKKVHSKINWLKTSLFFK